MYITNDSILETPAEAVVVPVLLTTGRKSPLHTAMETLFGKDYPETINEDIADGSLKPGHPTVYVTPPGFEKLIINFPIPPPLSSGGFDMHDFITTLHALFDQAKEWKVESLAVGSFENNIPWDVVESIIMRMERTHNGKVEVWYYSPEEPELKEEPLICSAV